MIAHPNWRQRQRALADFGLSALRTRDLDALFETACSQIAQGLNVPIAKVGLRQKQSDTLLLRAAVGIPPSIVIPGATTIPSGKGSAMGYAIDVGAPVISDVPSETRFDPSDVILRAEIRTTANVVLWVDGEAYGCLEAGCKEEWEVRDSDIDFLQSYANLVSAAIERTVLDKKVSSLAREREALLAELFHRINNMMANLDAIARRTIKHSKTLGEFRESFSGRLGTLARAYDLLIVAPDKPVSLRELLILEFESKGLEEGRDFQLTGDELLCSPRNIQILALLVFELATNAVKHGALSKNATEAAHILVSWKIDPSQGKKQVILIWRETGVKMDIRVRKRFGSELIERIVPDTLEGTTELTRREDGIECVLTFPINEEEEANRAIARRAPN